MESYRELRDRQQKEFNELPLGFAFSDKQFDEMMEKWGLDPEKDLDKIYRVPGGGFIQKKDHEHFHEVLDRHNVEMEAAKAAGEDGTGFLYQMFKYELDNQYGYAGYYIKFVLPQKQNAEKEGNVAENDLIRRRDVLKLIEDIKCDDGIPKNYGTLLDIMRKIRALPAADILEKNRITQ